MCILSGAGELVAGHVNFRSADTMSRWFRLGAAVVAMIMIANLQYTWTLYTEHITKATGWKLSEIQYGWTLFIALETWAMPFSGWLIDRRGARLLMSIAGVLCGVGWAGLSFAHSLPVLYAFYALAGLGAAVVYCGSIGVSLKWFPDKRGLAAGIIAGGFGAGYIFFIPLVRYLIRTQDYQTSFQVTGIVQGLMILCAAQFLGGSGTAPAPAKAVAKTSARSHGHQFNSAEMLRTPHFYVLYLMMLMMGVGGLMVTANVSAVGKSLGIGASAIAVAIGFNAIGNGSSRIFWGWVSDYLGRERTMMIAFLLQAVFLTSVLTLGRRSETLFIVSLALVIFTWGEVYSLFPSATADYFGTTNASSNYGFMYSSKGVASIIGGGIAALLFEKTGSWNTVFYGSAILALISALMAVGLKAMPLPVKRDQESGVAATTPVPGQV
jgi:OFA family oxalate/formate antiporter-like MFS transporter